MWWRGGKFQISSLRIKNGDFHVQGMGVEKHQNFQQRNFIFRCNVFCFFTLHYCKLHYINLSVRSMHYWYLCLLLAGKYVCLHRRCCVCEAVAVSAQARSSFWIPINIPRCYPLYFIVAVYDHLVNENELFLIVTEVLWNYNEVTRQMKLFAN